MKWPSSILRAVYMAGIQGLRVVDASIFPLLLPGYPMATVCECFSILGFLLYMSVCY